LKRKVQAESREQAKRHTPPRDDASVVLRPSPLLTNTAAPGAGRSSVNKQQVYLPVPMLVQALWQPKGKAVFVLFLSSLLLLLSLGDCLMFRVFSGQKPFSRIIMGNSRQQPPNYSSVNNGNSHVPGGALDVESLQAKMRSIHESRVNLSYEWRMKQLKLLLRLVQENTEELRCALAKDLGREGTEAICIETKPLENDIKYTMKNLKKWMKPQAVPSPAVMIPAFSYLESKPLNSPGVLIIGPFNYPVRLVLQPLLGALAGGNPAVVKPSENVPNVAVLLKNLLEQYYTEPGVVQVVMGGAPETTALLEKRWGKVFFTGSERVGRIVQKACAETMSPTILELGGKCPVVVDENVPSSTIDNVARRIVFGKCINAGQTCVAPDIVYVHKSHATALCEAMVRSIEEQFGTNPETGELARIVNTEGAQRVVNLIEDAEKLGGKVICGGSKVCNAKNKYICPTIILDPPKEAKILNQEVFSPIMAIVPFSTREEGIQLVQNLPGEPLHLYIFTSTSSVFQEYTDKCTASGAFRNDIMLQAASHHLPFGGIGTSGNGNYYGKFSFDSFTHTYPVAYRPLRSLNLLETLRCHPFGGLKGKLLEKVIFSIPDIPVLHTRRVLFCVGGILVIMASPGAAASLKTGLIFVLEYVLAALKG
jgi:acyl-CoA reductase-like NAD-dependent aldehyde dehydrogenase